MTPGMKPVSLQAGPPGPTALWQHSHGAALTATGPAGRSAAASTSSSLGRGNTWPLSGFEMRDIIGLDLKILYYTPPLHKSEQRCSSLHASAIGQAGLCDLTNRLRASGFSST